MKKWVDRTKSLDQEILDTETTRWIAGFEMISRLPMVMLPLARRHVEDWFKTDEDDVGYLHFKFAFDAVKMVVGTLYSDLSLLANFR